MANDLTFSWATPEDLSALEAFQATAYGSGAVQSVPGRTRWMYFEHPLGLHVSLCRHQDRIIAACGHLPQTVRVKGLPVTAGFGVDFMVADGFRRRGIGRRFLDMRLERFELSLSTGQSPGMLALYRTAGAVDLGPLGAAVFRRRPSPGGPPRKILRDATLWLRGLAAAGARKDGLRDVTGADADDPWLRWRYQGPVYDDYATWSLGESTARGRRHGEVRLLTRVEGADRADLLATLARTGPARETRMLFAGDVLAVDLRRAGFHLGRTAARIVALARDSALADGLRPGCLELTADAADADLLRSPG